MNLYPHYPPRLARGEFALLRFVLALDGPGRLDPATWLGLRGPLRQAARECLGEYGVAWFEGALSADPLALRRHQKPAPGFVLHPDPAGCRVVVAGDRVSLDVLFLGAAVATIDDFAGIVQHRGAAGLAVGNGKYTLTEVHASATGGGWRQLWSAPQPLGGLAPDVIRIDHWLDGHWPARQPLRLEFRTPLRLLAGGRVLRAPYFAQLFPFLLRRVTSMLHAYCDLDPVEEPAPLIAAARRVDGVWRERRWLDWRDAGAHGALGGVLGVLEVAGPELEELLWVLALAPLFGVGKGAAYGAGQVRLLPPRALAEGNVSDIM